jgi:5'-methylthioadenosine phosphorylase
MATHSARIGIIGGSGLYDMAEVTDRQEVTLTTPFGDPSGPYLLGTLRGKRVAFLARHGAGHRLSPSELNFRANIFGLKLLGVEYVLSASAVGSLKEEYKPLDIVVPDQFIDRTRGRVSTFFGRGLVAHVGFAHPFCRILSGLVGASGDAAGATIHRGGTYVCMEGPQFSTLAESRLYRSWGADIIGMTNLQEARLAREAEICYASLSMVTDYDCWHETEEAVSGEAVMEVVRQNVEMSQRVVREILKRVSDDAPRTCGCGEALKYSLITERSAIPAETLRALAPIVGKYIPAR